MSVDEPCVLAISKVDGLVSSHVRWQLRGVVFWVDSYPDMLYGGRIADVTDF